MESPPVPNSDILDRAAVSLSLEVGTLPQFLPAWETLSASEWALKVLRTGYRLVWGPVKAPTTNQVVAFPLPVLESARAVLDQEVQTLVDKRAI